MSLARLVVTAVLVEGRPTAMVARDYGVSRRWVHELVRRFRADGEAGLEPRSRRPRSSPKRVPEVLEEEILALRKELADQGLDAGAHTIAYHLERRGVTPPSVATIWRVLSRRGFVTPQPQKRPKSSYVRFQAEMPNERWQADITHWKLADGIEVEILNALDDHSRFLVGSAVRVTFKAADVVAAACGFPAELLTDNGAVFTALGGAACRARPTLQRRSRIRCRDRSRATTGHARKGTSPAPKRTPDWSPRCHGGQRSSHSA